jgi:hypothetical protein
VLLALRTNAVSQPTFSQVEEHFPRLSPPVDLPGCNIRVRHLKMPAHIGQLRSLAQHPVSLTQLPDHPLRGVTLILEGFGRRGWV